MSYKGGRNRLLNIKTTEGNNDSLRTSATSPTVRTGAQFAINVQGRSTAYGQIPTRIDGSHC